MQLSISLSIEGTVLVNSAPPSAIIRLSDNEANESASVGDLIGILSVDNGTGTYAFTITDDAGGKFDLDAVDDTRLEVAGALDFETASSHDVTIEADNGVDPPISRIFTINVLNDLAEPTNNVAPVVSGTEEEGSTLSVTDGTWTGSPTFAYQWYRAVTDAGEVVVDENDDPVGVEIVGATSNTYELVADDVDEFIFCIVTGTNSEGSVDAHSNVTGLITGGVVIPWEPADLGVKLLHLWDAENVASVGTSGTDVTSWEDTVGNNVLTALGAPQYGATSFAGRPGITFDGTDDALSLDNASWVTAFPTGQPFEVWAVIENDMPTGTTGNKTIISWGSTASSARLDLRRVVAGSQNRFNCSFPNGSTSQAMNGEDITGAPIIDSPSVIRAVAGATEVFVSQDGVDGAATAFVTASIGTVRVRIGASTAGTPGAFFGGKMNAILITQLLTTGERDELWTWCTDRLAA